MNIYNSLLNIHNHELQSIEIKITIEPPRNMRLGTLRIFTNIYTSF